MASRRFQLKTGGLAFRLSSIMRTHDGTTAGAASGTAAAGAAARPCFEQLAGRDSFVVPVLNSPCSGGRRWSVFRVASFRRSVPGAAVPGGAGLSRSDPCVVRIDCALLFYSQFNLRSCVSSRVCGRARISLCTGNKKPAGGLFPAGVVYAVVVRRFSGVRRPPAVRGA